MPHALRNTENTILCKVRSDLKPIRHFACNLNILVPVNGNGTDLDKEKIKEELNNIYHPVAVDWQVSTDTSNFSASADSLDVTGSGLFSQCTPGMKKLNNAFVAHKKTDFDASAIYLFVLQYSDKDGAPGDMPRSKQFGYLFTKTALAGGEKAIYRTIAAHELAHVARSLPLQDASRSKGFS